MLNLSAAAVCKFFAFETFQLKKKKKKKNGDIRIE